MLASLLFIARLFSFGEYMKTLFEKWDRFLLAEEKKDWNSAHCVLFKGDKVLAVQRTENDHWMPGKYALPGGNKDKGENLEEALKREIQEEVGLIVEMEDLHYLPEISHKMKHAFYVCKRCSGKLKLNANGVVEHDDAKWVSKEEIKKLDTVPDFKEVVIEARKVVG
jgi:8-oxo-dGTP diphosphatase